MFKNNKVEWIWNYYKGKALLTQATPSEFLKHESDEFLDIVIEDICEYENARENATYQEVYNVINENI